MRVEKIGTNDEQEGLAHPSKYQQLKVNVRKLSNHRIRNHSEVKAQISLKAVFILIAQSDDTGIFIL